MAKTGDPSGAVDELDQVVLGLQSLRHGAGSVSYAEIADRIARRRMADGQSEAAARIARSTVFDVFRTGRRRINARLVEEVALALGASPADAAAMRRRCAEAFADAVPVPAATPAPTEHALEATVHQERRSAASAPAELSVTTLRTALVVAVMAACVGLNLFGGTVAEHIRIPLFFDMIGTAATAFALGPWHAAVVGLVTNLLGAAITTPETVVFALVNISGALVWGYGIRLVRRSWWRFLLLTVVVATVCTLIAVPLNAALYDGHTGHASDPWIADLRAVQGLWGGLFSVNVVVSVADKLIAGLLGAGIAHALAPLDLAGRVLPRAAGTPTAGSR